MLYQYYSPSKDETAEELILRLYKHHPVFLSWSLRAEVAALDGRRDRANQMIELLEEHGYPEIYIDDLRHFVDDHVSSLWSKQAIEDEDKENPWEVVMRDPAIEVSARYYEDKINREHFQALLEAGINPFPQVRLKLFTGVGSLKQRQFPRVDNTPLNDNLNAPADIEVDETILGIDLRTALSPFNVRPFELYGRAGTRQFSGDATHSEPFFNAGISTRPIAPLSFNLSLEMDSIPSAITIVEKTTYEAIIGQAVYDVKDWWKIGGAVQLYQISDNNERDHAAIYTKFEVNEEYGIWVGGRYDHVTSKESRDSYWTPYRLTQIGLTGDVGKRFGAIYAGFDGFFGLGKERIREDSREEYEALRLQAIEQDWIDELGDAPSSEWQEVLILNGQLRYDLDKDRRLFLRSSYIRQPNHYEYHLSGGAQYQF